MDSLMRRIPKRNTPRLPRTWKNSAICYVIEEGALTLIGRGWKQANTPSACEANEMLENCFQVGAPRSSVVFLDADRMG